MRLARLLESQFRVARALIVGRAALGLVAVLRAWRGDRPVCRVALPGAVCHEVVVAVFAAGCEPVFCDIIPETGLVAEAEWRLARSRGADAAIVVHLYGNPAPVTSVRGIFPAANCLLIDDAAQALGSHRDGTAAGAGGDVGLLSFGHTKHIDVGSAAVLFHSASFADQVARRLAALDPAPLELREQRSKAFRDRLESARARLRGEGDAARGAFTGLLDELEALLYVAPQAGAEQAVAARLASYPSAARARVAKAQLWSRELQGSGLVPVGMGAGCVPWRYACRLPGADWVLQERLAAALRAGGMHVSNWYLPAHWFVAGSPALPGVERLAREVFQFWLDDVTTPESIAMHGAMARCEVGRWPHAVNA
jgi:dTDP-4-amino-4,6-dideoxygalactose transaminase